MVESHCAALGIRMHSGWGVLVAVTGDAHAIEVVDRRRIITIDSTLQGSKHPYHHAAGLPLERAEQFLAERAAVSERLATAAIGEVLRDLAGRHYRIERSVVLPSSGRPLPSLSTTLTSHVLIHAAEGEFFCHAVRGACERLDMSVTALAEKELDERVKTALGKAAPRLARTISALRRAIGPPWTSDHKKAALAAAVMLARKHEGPVASTRASGAS